jgi:hypothetical protein
MSHTCRPGHPGILADDCERCDQHAAEPMLLSLDGAKMEQLWDKMVEVEYTHLGDYVTANEAKACKMLYALSVWMERHHNVLTRGKE